MDATTAAEHGVEMGNYSKSGKEDVKLNMGRVEFEIYQQVELMADEEHDSPETKKKKRMARAALTMWKEQLQELKEVGGRGKTEMNSVMNEVYQLVSLYSVFAGVVLTAVATSSGLQCQHLWSPIGLCLFAYSIVAVKKFQTIDYIYYSISCASEDYGVTIRCIQNIKRLGYDGFYFTQHVPEVPDLPFQSYLWRNSLSLTVFTAGSSFVHILCWSSKEPKSSRLCVTQYAYTLGWVYVLSLSRPQTNILNLRTTTIAMLVFGISNVIVVFQAVVLLSFLHACFHTQV